MEGSEVRDASRTPRVDVNETVEAIQPGARELRPSTISMLRVEGSTHLPCALT